MIDVLIAIAITGLIFVAFGAPFAFSIRRRSEGWIALATDSLAFGLVVVPLVIAAWSLFGAFALVLAAAVLAAFIVLAVRSGAGVPEKPRMPQRSLLVTWLAIGLAAIALRLHNANFLPWVGDMGAYVNWANEFVRTGELEATWPPIYSSFLSLSGAIFGPHATTAGIAVTGLAFLAVVARLLVLLAVNRWVVAGVVGSLALNIHAVWYSTFPSSESLNAPVFITWATLVVIALRADRARLPAALGLVFLTMLHLCLLRGSGSFLLAPALVLAIASIAIPAWRAWGPRLWAFFVASLVAAEVGVWYGVSVIPSYFVDMQLGFLLPKSLFTAIKGIGIFSPGPLLFAALVVMTALASVGLLVARRLSDRSRGKTAALSDPAPSLRSTRVLALIAAVVLLLLLVAALLIGSNIWAILWRSGIWIALVPLLGLFAISRRRTLSDDVPVVFLLIATALVLMVFHSSRLGNDRIHAFFIYWDRYLYSEVIPALVVVAAIGVSATVARARSLSALTDRRVIPSLVVALAIVAVSAPHAVALTRMSQDTYMAGAYDFTLSLASRVDSDEKVLWGATSAEPAADFFFPNTWMAFAVPLERTFGFEFGNVEQGIDDFAPDEVVSDATLDAALTDANEVIVFETVKTDGLPLDERASERFAVEKVGTESSNISLLPQGPGLREWDHSTVEVVIWRVSRAAD